VQRFVDASLIGWYKLSLRRQTEPANEMIKKRNPEMTGRMLAIGGKMQEYGIVDPDRHLEGRHRRHERRAGLRASSEKMVRDGAGSKAISTTARPIRLALPTSQWVSICGRRLTPDGGSRIVRDGVCSVRAAGRRHQGLRQRRSPRWGRSISMWARGEFVSLLRPSELRKNRPLLRMIAGLTTRVSGTVRVPRRADDVTSAAFHRLLFRSRLMPWARLQETVACTWGKSFPMPRRGGGFACPRGAEAPRSSAGRARRIAVHSRANVSGGMKMRVSLRPRDWHDPKFS